MANLKAYVIRLVGVDASEKLAFECIRSGLAHDLEINPFDGIYGEEHISHQERIMNIKPRCKIKKQRIGVRGCFLSHYMLWVHCIRANVPFLILEHDAVILRPLPENVLGMFREFLMLDPYNKMKEGYADKHQVDSDVVINEYFNPRKSPKYKVEHDYAMGLQGYIIKPKAAIKLITDVNVNGYLPADIQCNKGLIHMETIYPSIVSINPKFYNNKELMREESTTHKDWKTNT